MPVITPAMDDPRWLEFVAHHPDATPFHTSAWSHVLEACYGYRPLLVAVADADGRLQAGLPLMAVQSRLTGRRIVALPFSDYCVPLASDDAGLRELLDGLQVWWAEHQRPTIEIRWPLRPLASVYPGEKMVRHVTPLDADAGQMLRRFKKSVVRLIHQAESAGLTIQQSDTWEAVQTYYRLHVETRRRLGAPTQPFRFFRLLWEHMLRPGQGFVLLAYQGETPIAGAVFLHANKLLVYKYGASLAEYWRLRPNNLLFWRAIQWGCENGYQTFDWGRTDYDDEGLRQFKQGWGSAESVLQYSILSSQAPTSAKGRLQERYLPAVIQKSPAWVGRAIGEVLYGHFA